MRLPLAFAFSSLILTPTVVHAGQSFSQWFVGDAEDKTAMIAGTTNDSGSILLEYCTYASKTCKWALVVDTACESGSVYSALGNSESGASVLSISCDAKTPVGKYRYILNWKEIESLIKGGSNLGIAVAAVNGKFFVHRFSLEGMAAATHVLDEAFWATVKRNEAGTGTVVL